MVDGPAYAVSFLLAAAGSDGIRQVATSIIVNRLTESLRHQAGLTYVIDHDLEPVHGEGFDLVVYAEPPAESVIDAVRLMITTVTSMLAHGPDEAEFVEAVDRERERHRGRQAMIDEIGTRALDQLLARSQGSAEADPLIAITRDQLTSYLRGLSNDVLYLADIRSEDVLVELGVPLATRSEVMTETLPAGTVYRPPLPARAISAEARGARVIVSDDGLYYGRGRRGTAACFRRHRPRRPRRRRRPRRVRAGWVRHPGGAGTLLPRRPTGRDHHLPGALPPHLGVRRI